MTSPYSLLLQAREIDASARHGMFGVLNRLPAALCPESPWARDMREVERLLRCLADDIAKAVPAQQREAA